MTERQVEDALREIVINNSQLELRSIEDGQALAGDLGFDSFAFLITLSDLEDRFGMEFPVENIDELQDLTFRDLVRLVLARVRRRSSGLGAASAWRGRGLTAG